MDLLARPILQADHRISYGPGASQFGDLWLPPTPAAGLLPVVAFFHGGWWELVYDLGYAGYLCAALKSMGIATWSIEYRRVGNGGGWPTTFQDAAAGFDHLRVLAATYPLDLDRVLTAGHSAGGQLAFWVAGRRNIPDASELFVPDLPLQPRGCISLAGAVDLRLVLELAGDGVFAHDRDEVLALMGGSPEGVPERYRAGDPGHLLPFPAEQLLLQGTEDDQIPPDLPRRWAEKARRTPSQTRFVIVPGADHLAVVDPESLAWSGVASEIEAMLSRTRPGAEPRTSGYEAEP